MPTISSETFCGQWVSPEQIQEIGDIVSMFPKLTRTELANTICELFAWKRPTGKLKTVECRQFLERLDAMGIVKLPSCRKAYVKRRRTEIQQTLKTRCQSTLSMDLRALSPITLHRVTDVAERQLWYEYMNRYHYLGYRIPFGAQLRYFVQSGIKDTYLGCLQFSSPAWRMAARDRWIAWSDEQRSRNLQLIVNNSRFLIFPWVKVKNLASTVLSLAAKIVPTDWFDTFGYRPALMETLVDKKRFPGTCYKAANWVYVGETTGRGRMDRKNKRKGMEVKNIYLYPLSKYYRTRLQSIEEIEPIKLTYS